MSDFLLEIGCEEIPARMIDAASLELRERVRKLLHHARLLSDGEIDCLDTPRRLAVLATGVSAVQPDIIEQLTGPAVSVAFKDGQPAPAAHAFAKKAGVDVSKLERTTTPKGEYLSAKIAKKGRTAAEVLADSLPKEIASVYWPKSMYWRKPTERFVRPVRWLVAMLDSEIVPLEFDGIRAGNQSRGHGILRDAPVRIPSAGAAYVSTLEQAKVLGREAREMQIRKSLDTATRAIPGARWREDKLLLELVVNLTEWPSAILGAFDSEFLELPEEVLVTVMRDHQKYFAVEDAAPLPRRAEHRWRSKRNHPAWPRARSASPLQRRTFLLADRPEAPAPGAHRLAEKSYLPERPRQLLRKDDSTAAAVQLVVPNRATRRAFRAPGCRS